MAVRKKKDFPLAVLEEMEKEVQPLLNSGFLLAHRIEDENELYHLIDNDSDSDFFFKISAFDVKAAGISYYVFRKPGSKRDLSITETWVTLKDLKTIFNTWIDIIKGYEKSNLYDDPILKSYQAGFEKEYLEILDDDAELTPFNYNQQLYIEKGLENILKKVQLLKDGKSDQDRIELGGVEEDVREIKKNLTKESKRKVIQRLSKMLAKAHKVGLNVAKEILVEVSANVITKLLTGGQV